MQDYMFIYRGGDHTWTEAAPEQKQALMAKWGAWFSKLGEKGQLVTGGSPLAFSGQRLTKDGVVTDIAASEVKELVSGYSIVKAKSLDEAVTIARECPLLAFAGALVEVRPVLSM